MQLNVNNLIFKNLIHIIKKKLQFLFKRLSYGLIKLFYGQIKDFKRVGSDERSSVIKSKTDINYVYKVFFVKKAILYTDTINDTAIIQDNKIVEGPSFQIRNVKFNKIDENIVYTKGTPRLKKKLQGKVFSLLTGGAGNYNYFHWLFDVLPRIRILEKTISLGEINYFLLPNNNQNFQKETLDILNIPSNKRLSSLIYRHVECEEVVATEHPWVIKNDASSEIQDLPLWIISWLRKALSTNHNLADKNFPDKIYIHRSDASPNIKALRKIVNENEVLDEIIKKNFKSIVLSNFTFVEQMKFFYNAKEIIGLHGAGFANFIFANAGTKVLELKPSSAGKMYENLAKKCNLVYDCISVIPEKHDANNQMGHINIDINLLKNKLSDL